MDNRQRFASGVNIKFTSCSRRQKPGAAVSCWRGLLSHLETLAAVSCSCGLLPQSRNLAADGLWGKSGDELSWPWQLTPFQKLSFSVDQVVRSLVDANIIGKGCYGVVVL
jgi:hypothetical protein